MYVCEIVLSQKESVYSSPDNTGYHTFPLFSPFLQLLWISLPHLHSLRAALEVPRLSGSAWHIPPLPSVCAARGGRGRRERERGRGEGKVRLYMYM